HRRSVDRFYDALSQRNYQTELATGYRRRFEKYRARRRRVPARVRPSHRSLEVYSVLLRGQYWIGTEHKFAGARPRPIFQKPLSSAAKLSERFHKNVRLPAAVDLLPHVQRPSSGGAVGSCVLVPSRAIWESIRQWFP